MTTYRKVGFFLVSYLAQSFLTLLFGQNPKESIFSSQENVPKAPNKGFFRVNIFVFANLQKSGLARAGLAKGNERRVVRSNREEEWARLINKQ